MFRLLGKVIGTLLQIILIPIALIVSIPLGILKARELQRSRLLFTGKEQSLLAKAQRAIRMENNGLFSPDSDLLEVAKCIEASRCEYQIIKNREKFENSFSDFVLPRIADCHIRDWDRVISHFQLSELETDLVEEVPAESVGVEELLSGLKNFIAMYQSEHGNFPRAIMLDHNVHVLFANAGIFRNARAHFGDVSILPVASIEGGLMWKALAWPSSQSRDDVDDDIPF